MTETLSTLMTFKTAIFSVNSHMTSKGYFTGKTLSTLITSEWLHSSVKVHVIPKV